MLIRGRHLTLVLGWRAKSPEGTSGIEGVFVNDFHF